MRIQPGTSLGPYRIVEAIAAGGMGEVYRAEDTRLGRSVAIKVLASAPDPERLGRFEREARATAVLNHRNIVTVFDIGTHEGLPFLVSELLEGRTLRALIQAGPVAAREAVELTRQLAEGASAAHALRIIHRDLKPENAVVTGDGTLKILDFGLAKLKPDPFAHPDADTTTDTRAGAVVGTLGYMAPEQLRGDPVDERTDIFAIGCILYEMLTGAAPFLRRSGADTIAAILDNPPAPIDARNKVPAALERLVLRCLDKDPADRFQNAKDLAFAADTISRDLSQPTAPHADSPKKVTSIAVLPFADMSATRDQDYFCEGIAEELINALAHIDGLRVAARGSSFQFRSASVDIRAVGARLGVDTVLEGSVRKVGDRLRINVQLIDVADGYHRWSERYDRKLEDVFAVQDEIAESVGTALRGILSAREKEVLHRPETAFEAYECFLRGRQHVHRANHTDYAAAQKMFRRAIEIDPDYAPAYAGLASVHAWMFEWWHAGGPALEAADRASRKALELAPNLSEAHTARGHILSAQDRYDEATPEFEEAVRLDPNSFDAHYLYGRMCFAAGRIEESATFFRRASELRPEDFQSCTLLTQSLCKLGREKEARAVTREAIRRIERHLELDPTDPRGLSLGALSLDDDGQRERALRWSQRAIELYPDDNGVIVNGACLRARAGMKEEAMDLLDKTFAKGVGKRQWIENDPDYDSLRDEPRFQAMLRKLQ